MVLIINDNNINVFIVRRENVNENYSPIVEISKALLIIFKVQICKKNYKLNLKRICEPDMFRLF